MNKLKLFFLILTITLSNNSNETTTQNNPGYSIQNAYHGHGAHLANHVFHIINRHMTIYNTTGEELDEEDQKNDKAWITYFYIRLLQDAQCYRNRKEIIERANHLISEIEILTGNFFSLNEKIEQEIIEKEFKRIQKHTLQNLIGSPEWIQELIAPDAVLDRKIKIQYLRNVFLKTFTPEDIG